MLENLQKIDGVACGDTNKFLELFKGLKKTIIDNPSALYKAFWKSGGTL